MMFAKRLKLLRVEQEITQADFAKIIGVAQQTVGSWEANKSSPNLETLGRIADYFNVSTDYLLGRENHNVSLSKEQKILLRIFSSLKTEAKNAIWTILNSLKVTHSTQTNLNIQNHNGNGNFFNVNGDMQNIGGV